VGAALRRACLLPALESPSDVGVILQRAGVAGEAARRWCERFAGDVGGDVPHAVVASVAAAAAAPSHARHRTVSGAWVSVHASALGDDVAVVLASSRRPELAPLLFAAHALTAREQVVAARVLEGDSNASIAARLGISVHTAKDHVKSVFAKTEASG